jgi:2-amino-4-hydroxy-6-hydroxymethyldihydropteridine diphosphokinase
MDERIAYIGLGSNLGDRAATLTAALEAIDATDGLRLVRRSGFVQTAPVGGPAGQGPFLNAAAEVATTLSPQALLERLLEIERTLGRRRQDQPRWSPRTCDLDILMIDAMTMHSETLTLPHPRMHQRRFVLEPLAQIAPGAVHPTTGLTVAQLLDQVDRQPEAEA